MRHIIATDNQVFVDESTSYELDCSALLEDDVVFIGEDGDGLWAEKEPFTGRITEYDFTEVERLFAEAEALHTEVTREPTSEEMLEQWRQTASVSAYQAEQALADFGLLDAVEVWLETDAGAVERRAWRRAQEWRYTSPTIEAACQALGITPEQKDALFKHAETIEA